MSEVRTETARRIMKYRRPILIISALLFCLCLGSLWFRGLNLGVDLGGGNSFTYRFAVEFEAAELRALVEQEGFRDVSVRRIGFIVAEESGGDVEIRFANVGESGISAAERQQLQKRIAARYGMENVALLSDVSVPPRFGREAAEKALTALALAALGIIVYVSLRFEWRPALATVVAVLFDVVVTAGIFSLFGLVADMTFIAAILTIVGYSVNDTLVIFDRIREKLQAGAAGEFVDIVERSIRECLQRTLFTSLTTLFAVAAILIFGGESTRSFAMAACIGVISGTYSSVYIACGFWIESYRGAPGQVNAELP